MLRGLNKHLIENINKIHSMFNLDNSQTFGIIGNNYIKYGDVVFGGEEMTMIVWIMKRALIHIEAPIIIFNNKN